MLSLSLGLFHAARKTGASEPIDPPEITVQPQSSSITEGTSVLLEVTATGTEPLSYQWYNGMSGDESSPLVGYTGETFTTGVLTSESYYWVKVSNIAGSVNSDTAVISIISPAPEEPSLEGFSFWGTADGLSLNDNDAVATFGQDGITVGETNPSARPIFKEDVINGKPVIRFSGLESLQTIEPNSARTVIAVLKWSSPASGHNSFFNENGTDAINIRLDSTNPWYLNSGSTNFSDFTHAGGKMWINGVEQDSHAEFDFDAFHIITAQASEIKEFAFQIGNVTNGGRRFKGDLAEIVVFPIVLTDEQREAEEARLAAKYDIVVNHEPPAEFDADAQAFFDRVAANSGSISPSTKEAVNALITKGKAGTNWWAEVDHLGLLCGDQLAAALTPVKTASGFDTEQGFGWVEGDYSEETGLTGDGATKYINTRVNGSQFTSHDTHLSFYSRSSSVITCVDIGYLNSSEDRHCVYIWNLDFTSNQYAGPEGGGATGIAVANTQGLFLGTRLSSTDHAIYKNGIKLASNPAAQGTLSATDIYVFAGNTSGSPSNRSSRTLAAYSIGKGMTEAQAAQFAEDLEEFQVALGRGVMPVTGLGVRPTLVRAHLAADSLSLNNNDPVSSWEDKTLLKGSFTASSGAEPIFKTGILNSKPCIRFNGSSQTLVGGKVYSGNAVTVFGVVSYGVEDKGAGGIFGRRESNRWVVYQRAKNIGINISGPDYNTTTDPFSTGVPHIFCAELSGAGINIYIDDVLVYNDPVALTLIDLDASIVGSEGMGGFFNGDIFELAAIRGVSTEIRTAGFLALQSKYFPST